jgi:hypothetical protein
MKVRIWQAVAAFSCVLACAGVSFGVAQASIPDASGTIHACYRPNGLLRVIDTGTHRCRAHEMAISWPSTASPGLAGWQLIQCTVVFNSVTNPGQPAVSGNSLCSATGPVEITVLCPPGKVAVQEAGSLLSFDGQGYATVNPDGSGAVFANAGNDGTFSVQLACANGST